MSILAAGMRKVNADVSFERKPVRREASVAIDAKQGAAGRPRIGDEAGTDLAQVGRKSADERQRWFDNGRLVSRLVLGEPLAVVVPLQLPQKYEDFWAEESRVSHQNSPVQTSVYRLRSACLY